MTPDDSYALLSGVVIPRPIAWVSTLSLDGIPNLAPFSYSNAVGGPPPVVMFSVAKKPDGSLKDSLRNVMDTGEFVLHIADEPLAEHVNLSSGSHPAHVSEFVVTQLQAERSEVVKPPRVAAAPVALEARVQQLVPVEGTTYTMVLGRVVRFHVREDLFGEDGFIVPARLSPLSRLGGPTFGTLGRTFVLPMPQVKP
ncbi:flavin reductase family protein [Deinococcus sp.]|uniref:flavin reductase family protein n=1 Tax=Deinococcus sp. TaxID=47478 RepID=UPI003CC53213